MPVIAQLSFTRSGFIQAAWAVWVTVLLQINISNKALSRQWIKSLACFVFIWFIKPWYCVQVSSQILKTHNNITGFIQLWQRWLFVIYTKETFALIFVTSWCDSTFAERGALARCFPFSQDASLMDLKLILSFTFLITATVSLKDTQSHISCECNTFASVSLFSFIGSDLLPVSLSLTVHKHQMVEY